MSQQHPTPESGERFRSVTGKEGVAVMVGGGGGAAVNAMATIHLNEGLTTDEKNDMLDNAHGRLDSYQQVARDARKSNNPNAPATARFTGQEIAQTKQHIVAISDRKPIDTAEAYGEALGWGALIGVAAVTSLTHITRRVRHYRANR